VRAYAEPALDFAQTLRRAHRTQPFAPFAPAPTPEIGSAMSRLPQRSLSGSDNFNHS